MYSPRTGRPTATEARGADTWTAYCSAGGPLHRPVLEPVPLKPATAVEGEQSTAGNLWKRLTEGAASPTGFTVTLPAQSVTSAAAYLAGPARGVDRQKSRSSSFAFWSPLRAVNFSTSSVPRTTSTVRGKDSPVAGPL